MSCSPIWSVHCDACRAADCWGWSAQEETLQDARRFARARGWVRRRAPAGNLMDLCPACAQ